MKKLITVLTALDFAILVLSASAADSESIAPLIICAVSVFLLIPLAFLYKDDEEDE